MSAIFQNDTAEIRANAPLGEAPSTRPMDGYKEGPHKIISGAIPSEIMDG